MGIKIEKDVPLAPYTTFRVGGPARFFTVVMGVGDLSEAIRFSKKENLPVFLLGGGSNILIADSGFPGLVIKFNNTNYEIKGNKNHFLVVADAGIVWDDFVGDLVSKNIGGLENLSLIPGSVGGAVVQNIGAYGVELGNFIESVKVFDVSESVEKVFHKSDCEFGYRNSIFKKNKNLIVLGAEFKLPKNQKPNIDYKDLKIAFAGKDNITPSEVREAVISIRSAKLPDYRVIGTAGSYFKNPVISDKKALDLQRDYPELPIYPLQEEGIKISAAYLMDKALDLKGFHLGLVYTHPKQALVLCAESGAKTEDVLKLAKYIKRSIFEKTGIELEEEVEYIS